MTGQVFGRKLREALSPLQVEQRSWVYVPYDQLTDRVGMLAKHAPSEVGIVMVESADKAARRPYHKQKLALILANQRHFALEQARRGVFVDYRMGGADYASQLATAAAERGPLRCMRPAERELRENLAALVASGDLVYEEHGGWLSTREDFVVACGEAPPWRVDAFYRRMRKQTGWLMEGGKPLGGKLSLDADNRQPWPGEPAAPEPPRFRADEITEEVVDFVNAQFAEHPGTIDVGALPASRRQAERLWSWALEHCMPHFGPYEDAMARSSSGLFHTRISPLLNLHRLLPQRVIEDVLATDLPLQSKEGFTRQILGWREFVHHVHEMTDGFRTLGGPHCSHLDLHADLPRAYWDASSGLGCLDHVVEDVWREAYSHHITRLMILGNIATLIGVSPRALTDWFWVAYVDAFDWVVEPNVLAMATFGTGPVMTTKPYVSGAAYIDRMSDYCGSCAFHPKKDCPITSMYWNFLGEQADRLSGNPRLRMPLASLRKRSEGKRAHDRAVSEWVRKTLAAGGRLKPEGRPAP